MMIMINTTTLTRRVPTFPSSVSLAAKGGGKRFTVCYLVMAYLQGLITSEGVF